MDASESVDVPLEEAVKTRPRCTRRGERLGEHPSEVDCCVSAIPAGSFDCCFWFFDADTAALAIVDAASAAAAAALTDDRSDRLPLPAGVDTKPT